MKSLQKIIATLLLALALGGQDTIQANILELLRYEFLKRSLQLKLDANDQDVTQENIDELLKKLLKKPFNVPSLPIELGFAIGRHGPISHVLKYIPKQTITPQTPNVRIWDIKLSSDDNTIVLRLNDICEVWTKQNGQFAFYQLLTPHTPNLEIWQIKLSSDGNTIVLRLSNNTCEAWTKQNGQFAFYQLLIPNTPNAETLDIRLSSDGNTIVLKLRDNHDDRYNCEAWTKQDGQFVFLSTLNPSHPKS